MNYTSSATITVNYTIPARLAVNNLAARYHLEVFNATTGQTSLFSNPTVVPAIAPVVGVNQGTPGSAVFTGVSLPSWGIYFIHVCYANADDLDTSNVILTKVANIALQRIRVLTTIPIIG
jgi:hypothetical protein